jgi:PAS domain S-box-containing protein
MKSMDNPYGEAAELCKQTEESLRETQAILKAAMDNSQVGIAIVDAGSGTLRYVNEAGLLIRGGGRQSVANGIGIEQYMAGWQLTDLDGKSLKPDEVPLRAIMSGEACCMEFIIRRTLDDERMVLANAAPIRDDNGKVVAGIIVFIDITERMRADAEKARLEAQLQQAMKMESVGRLAGGVAHDFNNMLGIIIGHAELAMGQVDPTQPLHAHLEEICKAANRSADLTRQLLAFARKQTVAPKVLDLNETVEGMFKMLRRLIGENIDLGWQPKANLWPVKVDPSQIDQILANLCVNSQDAISGVGKIIIETGNSTMEEGYCSAHPGSIPGEYVMLAVSDDGYGMDKKTLERIFEPFFTTKEMGKGTGLGLATVYGIVKQNNGFVNVYSEPGLGTKFTVYLPRYKGSAAPLPQEALAEPVARGNETILLVEDEPAILTLITTMLTKLGYTVLTAGTPGEIIRLADEYTGKIHLLITDVVMPGMNGKDLAGNLLSRYPHLKHLFMSGYTADVIAHNGILDDGVNFIQKPFSIKELAVKVREALGGCAGSSAGA